MGNIVLRKSDSGIGFTLIKNERTVIKSCQWYSSKEDCLGSIQSFFINLSSISIEDTTSDEHRCAANPKFNILFDEDLGYYFTLSSIGGVIIAKSTGYPTKLGCINAIDTVIKSLQPIIETQ